MHRKHKVIFLQAALAAALLVGSTCTAEETLVGVSGYEALPGDGQNNTAEESGEMQNTAALPGDGQNGVAENGDAQNADALPGDGQKDVSEITDSGNGGAQNAETAAGNGTEETEASTEEGDEQSTEALAGDGQKDEAELESETETESTMDEKLAGVLEEVQAALPTDNGSWSVYVADLKGGYEGSIDDHRMQAASLIKLYIMGAVYENYDDIIAEYGQDNVDSLLHSMITVSDNDAANTLTGYLAEGDSDAGRAVVNEYCMAHGYYTTTMGRLLLQSNENGDNYTSVSDCGHFLKMVYEGNTDENPHAEDMFALLAAQERTHKIPSQLPSEVSTANKTGELSDVENDAGILYNIENDLILVFMSENLQEVGSAQSTIGALSLQIYEDYL